MKQRLLKIQNFLVVSAIGDYRYLEKIDFYTNTQISTNLIFSKLHVYIMKHDK